MRRVVEREAAVLETLSSIQEPITRMSLTSLGMVRNLRLQEESHVQLDIDTLCAGYPDYKTLHEQCVDRLKALDWVRQICIQQVHTNTSINKSNDTGVSDVTHIIAVSSCKGGVGKSTVSTNLAYALAAQGLKVGLLDADVYGPSLPLMVTPDDPEAKVLRSKKASNFVLPLDAEGVKVLSFGHVNPRAGVVGAGGQGAAVIRGPVATRVINQLAVATDWGALDYLVVDFPPGTGDVPLTLCQSLVISGAVIVTTPHPLAIVDVAKGMQMFHDVKVPTLAIVENMASFTCDHGVVYTPFGAGGKQRMLDYFSLEDSPAGAATDTHSILTTLRDKPFHSFPIYMPRPDEGDQLQGSFREVIRRTLRPIVLSDPLSAGAEQFRALSEDCIREIFRLQVQASFVPSISYLESRGIILRYFTAERAYEYILSPAELRMRDPATGKRVVSAVVPHGVHPVGFDFKGSYGVAISWSDNHFADIYPFDVLKRIAEEGSSKS